jgi:hypothetical protein
MIMSKTKLNTLISLCAVGLALLTGATTAIANDSDRLLARKRSSGVETALG